MHPPNPKITTLNFLFIQVQFIISCWFHHKLTPQNKKIKNITKTKISATQIKPNQKSNNPNYITINSLAEKKLNKETYAHNQISTKILIDQVLQNSTI